MAVRKQERPVTACHGPLRRKDSVIEQVYLHGVKFLSGFIRARTTRLYFKELLKAIVSVSKQRHIQATR
jgi:hypothetical protein